MLFQQSVCLFFAGETRALLGLATPANEEDKDDKKKDKMRKIDEKQQGEKEQPTHGRIDNRARI